MHTSCEHLPDRVYSRLLGGPEMVARKTKTLVECLAEIDDPRTGNGKRHDLVEVLVIAICGIFAQVEGFDDIAEWAVVKECQW